MEALTAKRNALQGPAATARVAQQLHHACKDVGFFYITNHGKHDYLHAVHCRTIQW